MEIGLVFRIFQIFGNQFVNSTEIKDSQTQGAKLRKNLIKRIWAAIVIGDGKD